MNLTGRTPNGDRFFVNPRRVWLVDASRAVVEGVDLGATGRTAEQAALGDFLIPRRGLFAVATARMERTVVRSLRVGSS